MVLGNGLVASGFTKYQQNNDFLIFASGVSNSGNTDPDDFKREEGLLLAALKDHKDKTFVYFSTCSIYDPAMEKLPYAQHKLAMEALIQKQHDSFHIFRVSNLAGKTDNPHTVLNYFIQHMQSGIFFYVWKNATRNIIDIEDAVAACDYIMQQKQYKNEIVNVANPTSYPVPTIISTIEEVLGKKGNYELIDKGSTPHIESSTVKRIFSKLGIHFEKDYLASIIKKYFLT